MYYTPKFILQPIVENSVKYALVSGHITTINVSIEKQFNLELGSEDIVLLIKDNGPGMNKNMLVTIQSYLESDPMAKREAQFGLLNVQARIKMKFGKHYGLRIDSCEKKGTEVEIRIPVLYGAE
ncbi:MAG: sensor histidine kinase [Anaerobacillus sp.]|uniref:sensor histidine kinase n=1 Tax=Anaerobacillus sp. TaxID=1872506 RepID=UPI00391D7074